MMDSALTEYDFVKSFFHAEDTTIFTDIFHDVCKYVGLAPSSYLATNSDRRVAEFDDGLHRCVACCDGDSVDHHGEVFKVG